MSFDIVLIGGEKDFNMLHLQKRCEQLGYKHLALFIGSENVPSIHFDLAKNQLQVSDQKIETRSAFIRPDVFAYLQSKSISDQKKAEAWFSVFIGWLLTQDQVNLFNRRYYHRNAINKVETLILAKKLGFRIADTYVSNDLKKIAEITSSNKNFIVKPVTGGAFTERLSPEEISNLKSLNRSTTDTPKFIQAELVSPEVRIFRLGYTLISFKVLSENLDYRTDQKLKIEPIQTPNELIDRFLRLTDKLGLDFAAGDFKTDPVTGQLSLLEVNSGPMFAAFDQASKGILTEHLLKALIVR
jgi:glutathione synthase/RimK-type ligase-like ATP-grasp enzyme